MDIVCRMSELLSNQGIEEKKIVYIETQLRHEYSGVKELLNLIILLSGSFSESFLRKENILSFNVMVPMLYSFTPFGDNVPFHVTSCIVPLLIALASLTEAPLTAIGVRIRPDLT